MRASFGQPPDVVEYERQHPDRPGPQSCTGRVAMTKKPVHIPDVYADPDYTYPSSELHAVGTLLGLPVLVDDELVGVCGLARHEHRPFEEREIELMATFADQSAIAIANATLFETVERQKGELARFLSPEVAALVSSDEGCSSTTRCPFRSTSSKRRDSRSRCGSGSGNWPAAGGSEGTSSGSAAASPSDTPRSAASDSRGGMTTAWLGSVTNLAARLSDEAGSGEILLSQRAYAALEGRVDAEPVAELHLKGFTRPVEAYRLLGVRDSR
jgi:hypothetical protein